MYYTFKNIQTPTDRVVDRAYLEWAYPNLDIDDQDALDGAGFAAITEVNQSDDENTFLIADKVQDQWVGTWSTNAQYRQLKLKQSSVGAARVQRAALLAASDWTQLPDSPLTTEKRQQWAAYRQALRDITTQAGFPLDVNWPQQPAI